MTVFLNLSQCLSAGVLWLHSNNGRNLKRGDSDLHKMTKRGSFCAAVQLDRCKLRPRARKHAGVTFQNLCVNPLKQLSVIDVQQSRGKVCRRRFQHAPLLFPSLLGQNGRSRKLEITELMHANNASRSISF